MLSNIIHQQIDYLFSFKMSCIIPRSYLLSHLFVFSYIFPLYIYHCICVTIVYKLTKFNNKLLINNFKFKNTIKY